MHVQVITFTLDRVREDEYIDMASRLAPRFAGFPGLLAKLWLESSEPGTYGAIYFWEDTEAMERFIASDLFEGHTPQFQDFGCEDFSILQNLTRETQPVLQILDPPAPRANQSLPAPDMASTPEPDLPAAPAARTRTRSNPSAARSTASRSTGTRPKPPRSGTTAGRTGTTRSRTAKAES